MNRILFTLNTNAANIHGSSQKAMFNLSVNQLAEHFGVSRKTVLSWVASHFTYGVHYVNLAPPTQYSKLLRFNLKACQEYFLIAPEMRK